MFQTASNSLSFLLLGTGAAAWALAAPSLVQEPDCQVPPNPLGLKRSPYGEVLALALQSPISLYWHGGASGHEHHSHAEGEPCPDEEAHLAEGHDHDSANIQTAGLSVRFASFLDELNEAGSQRTNPKSATEAHRFAMRRKVEDQLRFAYELDPSHYGNYNSYHFILTQPTLGTRPELTPQASALTEATINYCLSRTDDPRPALTAAAAVENELTILFSEPGRHSLSELQQKLALLDQSLARHRELRAQWVESGNWNLLSTDRQQEIEERYQFTNKLRGTAAATIQRLVMQQSFPVPTATTPIYRP